MEKVYDIDGEIINIENANPNEKYYRCCSCDGDVTCVVKHLRQGFDVKKHFRHTDGTDCEFRCKPSFTNADEKAMVKNNPKEKVEFRITYYYLPISDNKYIRSSKQPTKIIKSVEDVLYSSRLKYYIQRKTIYNNEIETYHLNEKTSVRINVNQIIKLTPTEQEFRDKVENNPDEDWSEFYRFHIRRILYDWGKNETNKRTCAKKFNESSMELINEFRIFNYIEKFITTLPIKVNINDHFKKEEIEKYNKSCFNINESDYETFIREINNEDFINVLATMIQNPICIINREFLGNQTTIINVRLILNKLNLDGLSLFTTVDNISNYWKLTLIDIPKITMIGLPSINFGLKNRIIPHDFSLKYCYSTNKEKYREKFTTPPAGFNKLYFNKYPNEKQYVYFLQCDCDSGTNIYKIGLTTNLHFRLESHEYKNAAIFRVIEVNDCRKCERRIINEFTKSYGKPVRGNEYFQGDINKMLTHFIKCTIDESS